MYVYKYLHKCGLKLGLQSDGTLVGNVHKISIKFPQEFKMEETFHGK